MGGDLVKFQSNGGPDNYINICTLYIYRPLKYLFNFSHCEQHAANKTPNSNQPKVF